MKIKKIFINTLFAFTACIIFLSGFYFYLDVKWSRELNSTLQQLNIEGKIPKKENLIPPKIPDIENASKSLELIFETMTSGLGGKKFSWRQEYEYNDEVKRLLHTNLTQNPEILKNTELNKVLEYLDGKEIETIINYLKKAETKPFLNFYLDYEAGPDMLLPHLAAIRSLYKIICMKASYDADNNNLNSAYTLLLSGFKTLNLLQQEPIIISQLVRIACDVQMMETLNQIIQKYGISYNTGKMFINELRKHSSIEPFINIADTEIIFMGMYIYEGLLYGNDNLKWNNIKKLLKNPIPLDYLPTFLMKPFLKKDYTEYLKQMSEFKTFLKTPYWELSEERLTNLLNSTEAPPAYCIVCKMLMPSLLKLLQRITKYRTQIDKEILYLAVQLYVDKYHKKPSVPLDLITGILEKAPIDYATGKHLTLNDIN